MSNKVFKIIQVIAADEDYLLFIIGPAIVHIVLNSIVKSMWAVQGVKEDEVRISSDIDIKVYVIRIDISEIGVYFFKPVLPNLMATHDEDIIGF